MRPRGSARTAFSRRRAALAALALAAALTLPPRPAAADVVPGGPVFPILAVGFLALVAANMSFTVYDTAVAIQNERPSQGWATAEAIVATPQAALFNLMVIPEPDDDGQEILLLIPPLWTTGLATHGLWALTNEHVTPGTLAGLAPALGANLTFTLNAMAKGARGHLLGAPTALLQLAVTTPQIIVGSVNLANGEKDRAGWALLTGWSSALFLHGTASLILGPGDRREEGRAPMPRVYVGAVPDLRGPAPAVFVGGVF